VGQDDDLPGLAGVTGRRSQSPNQPSTVNPHPRLAEQRAQASRSMKRRVLLPVTTSPVSSERLQASKVTRSSPCSRGPSTQTSTAPHQGW
jgi:hypothetical protein